MVEKILKTDQITSKIIILVLLCISILLVSYNLVQLKEKVTTKEAKLEILKRDYGFLDQMVTDKEENEDTISEILKSLPQSYFDVGTLAYKIEQLAGDRELQSSLFFDKEKKNDKGLVYFEVTIKTKGTYQNYAGFLSDLTALPYNVNVESVTYENVKGEISQEILMKVYIQK